MPEIIFNGPEGRLEGRYVHSKTENAPIVLLLHPHPQGGGTMNNKVVYNLFNSFTQLGFSALRFNFRGVGRSQGRFDNGIGELADAAAALDWVQSHNADAAGCWIAGFSFGAWIGMQLLMRRPEIEGFILIVHGDADELVPLDSVKTLGTKLSSQRDITVKHVTVNGANHFFQDKLEEMTTTVSEYVDQARKEFEAVSEAS